MLLYLLLMNFSSSIEKLSISFLIDLIELGRIILVKVSCRINIPKSPNWLWIIENSNFLILNLTLF